MDQYTKIVLDNARLTGKDDKTDQPIYSVNHDGIDYEANNTYDLIIMLRKANNVDEVEHMEVIRESHGKPASA